MRNMKNWTLAISIFTLAVCVGCGSTDKGPDTAGTTGTSTTGGGGAVALTGAGSTFVNPAMSKWAYAYGNDHKDVTINYQSVGSGAGIAQFKAGTVDFGATDVAMPDDDVKTIPTEIIQIPMISGCTVLAYNVPGIANGLKLSGDVIADIYLGKITKWNDPRIVQQNAGVTLPDLPIAVVERSDGSGTTYIFTD